MTDLLPGHNFLGDLWAYAARMRRFRRIDWAVYAAWVGLMLGLLVGVAGFLATGAAGGVRYPSYVWNVLVGTVIFIVAIAFDTIGHRTAYREALKQGESLVHHLTIFAGISSVLLLCAAYSFPDAIRIPALVMVALSVFYSGIDEAMHWFRYHAGKSDRIEMWSHFFIFVGHLVMILSWWHWFDEGYPGVAETLAAMGF